MSCAERTDQTSAIHSRQSGICEADRASVSSGRWLRLRLLSNHLKGLILAQNERWRRGLGMQVEREICE